MSKGAGAPQAIDYTKLAALQDKSNLTTAVNNATLNNVSQQTPWGNLNFIQTPGKDGGPPSFTATQTLSPGQQGLLNQQTAIQRQAGTQASGILNNMPASGQNPNYQQFGSGPNLQNGVYQGSIQNQIEGAGDLTRNVTPGQVQNTVANAGAIDRTIDSAGNITRNINNAGNIQRDLGSNDFSGERQRVEDALMGRLNQQSDRDWESRRSELVNQGVREGSDAFTRAEMDFGRNRADQRTNAILGAGTEQNRMQQLALNSGNFANASQAQQYGQNANNAGFQNSAQAQQFGQNAQQTAATNAAQAQQYGQNANDTSVFNAAQAQTFGQGQANAALNNAAQGQQFGQNTQQLAAWNAAQGQNFQQDMANAGLNNQSLQSEFNNRNTVTAGNNDLATQGFNNQNTLRTNAINNANALRGGGQVQNPGYAQTNGSQMPTTDVAGLANQQYANQFAQYQQQQNSQNQMWGGLMGAGANLMMLSDRRAKTDIERVGKADNGLPIYRYRYKDGGPMQIGVMAQDVKKKNPGAVREVDTPRGRLMAVDYSSALDDDKDREADQMLAAAKAQTESVAQEFRYGAPGLV